MITPEAAWRLVGDCVVSLPPVSRTYSECLHYYLAQRVSADRDIPAAARSAMDGYALRAEDVTAIPAQLKLTGEVSAGSSARPVVEPRCCVRIMTGANVPPGADAVVRIEDTTDQNGAIAFLKPVRNGQNIIRQGENARKGETLLESGTRLDASGLALLAAVGCTEPLVYTRPDVGIISTGTELKDAEETVEAYEIRDSNGPLLTAAISENCFCVKAVNRTRDDRDRLRYLIASSIENNHVTIISGGVSVGKYDFVPEIIQALGGTVRFHGIAMKPGKPLLFATFGNDRYVFGLPGNPLAVLNGLHEYALPAMRLLSGCPLPVCRPLLRIPLAADVKTKGLRQHYLPARLVHMPGGTFAEALPHSGSSDFVTGCKAEGAVMIPRGTAEMEAGAMVEFRPWRRT